MAVQSKELVLGPWGKAVAGATGAVFANIMVYPLDMYVVVVFFLLVGPKTFNLSEREHFSNLSLK